MWSGSAPKFPAAAPTPPVEVGEPRMLMALHGHGIGLTLHVPSVAAVVRRVLGGLIEELLPGAPEIRGTVRPYAEGEVLRGVSPDAVRLNDTDPLLELYRDVRRPERFWLVDERWGICELDLLRRCFKSWVLPAPACDAVRLYEACVLWPIAQLLRGAGLHLIPAAGIGRDGRGVLILSPFDVGAELDEIARHGVGIVGQRWVALREEADGRIALLDVPGCSQQSPAPRLLSAGPLGQAAWADLADGRTCRHARCELVLIVEPMRRSAAFISPLGGAAAREQLKLAWPITQLSAGRSSTAAATNLLAAKLARDCRVHRVRLSRDNGELARLLVRPIPSAAAA